jgi:hypothetical protein
MAIIVPVHSAFCKRNCLGLQAYKAAPTLGIYRSLFSVTVGPSLFRVTSPAILRTISMNGQK